MESLLQDIVNYASQIDLLELLGLIFGLLAVYYLIKENILTWPAGIAYVLVSFVIFWQQKLYADFALHIFFLVLNIYGWWYWLKGDTEVATEKEVPITYTRPQLLAGVAVLSIIGIAAMGSLLTAYTDASLPYWDSATTVLSLSGMWLTARKKIENWYFWFIVDILATGVYFYKGIYFYAILYLIYIGLAIVGYLAWKKTMNAQIV